jgi:hypothetical protein
MCDKEAGRSQENMQSLVKRIPKVQQAEEIFPALQKNMVSVLCRLGIVLSCSQMIALAGVFDVPRKIWVMYTFVCYHYF